MKANLMFRDRDFDIKAEPCFGKAVLTADLELERIIVCMSRGDDTIKAACNAALFRPLPSPEDISYRQTVLMDALENPGPVRRLYEITCETNKKKSGSWYWLYPSQYLASTFSSAVGLLKIYLEMLTEFRAVADESLGGFKSEGFVELLTMLQRELSNSYLESAGELLEELKDGEGLLVSARLGCYLQGVDYVLRRKETAHFWRNWAFAPSYSLAPRDDAGAKDMGNRRDRAINDVTNALAQAAEHIESFFNMLRDELAFFVGCINLRDSLSALGMPICIPELLPAKDEERSWKALYDVSLALTKNEAVVGNELSASAKRLYIVTGANQGGKSTFLRSVGQAQLMAQAGMFVGAESFSAPVRNGVFTHFKKEEDKAMSSGKLDEELSRMSALADRLQSGSLILFNESFAATNEREGSEICRQITQALIENGIEVFSVTHLYTYAAAFLKNEKTQYLRAERLENGERSFRVTPGEPLHTAFGEDLYRKIFVKGGELA